MYLSHKDIERFWSKVNKLCDSECWDWTGSLNNSGYGTIGIGNMSIGAHRIAYELSNKDEIPDGMLILHKCDNRKCCNPSHLYCGTYSQNMIDTMNRNPIHGNPPHAKLHEGEIWLIRKLKIPLGSSSISQRFKFTATYVAKMFKVDRRTILRIWNSERWLCKERYYV